MNTPKKRQVNELKLCRLCGVELKTYEIPEEICDVCLRAHIDKGPQR